MKSKLVWISLVIALGCSTKSNNENESKPNDSTEVTSVNETDLPKEQGSDVKKDPVFVFTAAGDESFPKTSVAVDWNGKITHLKELGGNASLIDEADYNSKDIPDDAKIACVSWWAGAGDYFYAVYEGSNLVVYKGWEDEGQNDGKFHWEKFKTIQP